MKRRIVVFAIIAVLCLNVLFIGGCGRENSSIEDGSTDSVPSVGAMVPSDDYNNDDQTGNDDIPGDMAEGALFTEIHGALSVIGTDLVDQNGERVQLCGVSTHGLQWFPEYVNEGAFKCLRDDWGVNCIRLAMYTDEGGYCDGGGWVRLESIIDDGVTYATNLGMYVIIDWHILNDANLMEHLPEAMGFFRKMSAKYANHFNVIYEICDEYNGGASWEIIKQFADSVLPIIRAYDDDAIILVGTPKWSQDTDEVVQNLLGFDNIMYTFHFYAGTHKEEIRSKLIQARDFGIPIFVSEFSICDASGTGGIDYASADTWKELIDDDNISFIAWNLSNKNETSSLIRSSCTEVDYFTEDDLSDTGVYVRNWILMRSSK